MRKSKTVEATYCDACGIEIIKIGDDRSCGEFSIVAQFPTSYSTSYQTGTHFRNFGEYCEGCCIKLGQAFEDAMEKLGFVERYAMNDKTKDKTINIIKNVLTDIP